MESVTDLAIEAIRRLPPAEAEELSYRILAEIHATEVQRMRLRAKAA